ELFGPVNGLLDMVRDASPSFRPAGRPGTLAPALEGGRWEQVGKIDRIFREEMRDAAEDVPGQSLARVEVGVPLLAGMVDESQKLVMGEVVDLSRAEPQLDKP
ncbi:MAG: hypothetical protein WBK88_09205, partial [Methanothrix sp.]